MKTKSIIPKTFFIFLIASAFIWLLITFSKEYTTGITYTLKYNNIPQDRILQEAPVKKMDLTIKASGFKIVAANLKNKTLVLDASSLRKAKNNSYYFLVKNQLSSIKNQLHSGLQIVEIPKDTLFLNLGMLTSKKVPLKPNLDIEYHIGYDLLGNVEISPDSVLVSGSENQIKELNYLELELLQLKDVKNNFRESLKVLRPKDLKGLKISNHTASVFGTVEKFTEGSIEVPLTIKNVPKSMNLTTLSETVTVKYIVALSKFNAISEASLKVECDFEASEKNNLSYLIPELVTKPDFIKSYKIVPNKIDFLIQK